MTQWVKMLAALPDNSSWISSTHLMKRENQLPQSCPLTSSPTVALTWIHTINKQANKHYPLGGLLGGGFGESQVRAGNGGEPVHVHPTDMRIFRPR